MEIIKGASEINKAIVSIANRGKKLDADIWVAGVSCLSHASEHGDTTLLDKLVAALPKGARKNAFVEWSLAYGQVRLLNPKDKTEASAIKEGRLYQLDRTRTLDLEGAVTKAWYEFKPEPDVLTVFDLQASVATLIKRYNKAVESHAEIQHKDAAIAELKAMLERLEG